MPVCLWLPVCSSLPVCLWFYGIRAGTGACPYDCNDAVNVIGHGDEYIDIGTRIMGRDFIPNRLNHPPCIIQLYVTIHNCPEQALPLLRAKGDEIHPGLGIIVSL